MRALDMMSSEKEGIKEESHREMNCWLILSMINNNVVNILM